MREGIPAGDQEIVFETVFWLLHIGVLSGGFLLYSLNKNLGTVLLIFLLPQPSFTMSNSLNIVFCLRPE